jgi:hypothetical protein
MDSRKQEIGHLAQAFRAVDAAVTTVLADSELAAAGGLDRLAPFSRLLRFALADARVTGSVAGRQTWPEQAFRGEPLGRLEPHGLDRR